MTYYEKAATGDCGPDSGKHPWKNADLKLSPQAKWNKANPLALWAHAALRSALRKGLIEKEPCAVCGDPNSEAHHDPEAYDQPLAVTWLCRLHHKREHGRLRKGGA